MAKVTVPRLNLDRLQERADRLSARAALRGASGASGGVRFTPFGDSEQLSAEVQGWADRICFALGEVTPLAVSRPASSALGARGGGTHRASSTPVQPSSRDDPSTCAGADSIGGQSGLEDPRAARLRDLLKVCASAERRICRALGDEATPTATSTTLSPRPPGTQGSECSALARTPPAWLPAGVSNWLASPRIEDPEAEVDLQGLLEALSRSLCMPGGEGISPQTELSQVPAPCDYSLAVWSRPPSSPAVSSQAQVAPAAETLPDAEGSLASAAASVVATLSVGSGTSSMHQTLEGFRTISSAIKGALTSCDSDAADTASSPEAGLARDLRSMPTAAWAILHSRCLRPQTTIEDALLEPELHTDGPGIIKPEPSVSMEKRGSSEEVSQEHSLKHRTASSLLAAAKAGDLRDILVEAHGFSSHRDECCLKDRIVTSMLAGVRSGNLADALAEAYRWDEVPEVASSCEHAGGISQGVEKHCLEESRSKDQITTSLIAASGSGKLADALLEAHECDNAAEGHEEEPRTKVPLVAVSEGAAAVDPVGPGSMRKTGGSEEDACVRVLETTLDGSTHASDLGLTLCSDDGIDSMGAGVVFEKVPVRPYRSNLEEDLSMRLKGSSEEIDVNLDLRGLTPQHCIITDTPDIRSMSSSVVSFGMAAASHQRTQVPQDSAIQTEDAAQCDQGVHLGRRSALPRSVYTTHGMDSAGSTVLSDAAYSASSTPRSAGGAAVFEKLPVSPYRANLPQDLSMFLHGTRNHARVQLDLQGFTPETRSMASTGDMQKVPARPQSATQPARSSTQMPCRGLADQDEAARSDIHCPLSPQSGVSSAGMEPMPRASVFEKVPVRPSSSNLPQDLSMELQGSRGHVHLDLHVCTPRSAAAIGIASMASTVLSESASIRSSHEGRAPACIAGEPQTVTMQALRQAGEQAQEDIDWEDRGPGLGPHTEASAPVVHNVVHAILMEATFDTISASDPRSLTCTPGSDRAPCAAISGASSPRPASTDFTAQQSRGQAESGTFTSTTQAQNTQAPSSRATEGPAEEDHLTQLKALAAKTLCEATRSGALEATLSRQASVASADQRTASEGHDIAGGAASPCEPVSDRLTAETADAGTCGVSSQEPPQIDGEVAGNRSMKDRLAASLWTAAQSGTLIDMLQEADMIDGMPEPTKTGNDVDILILDGAALEGPDTVLADSALVLPDAGLQDSEDAVPADLVAGGSTWSSDHDLDLTHTKMRMSRILLQSAESGELAGVLSFLSATGDSVFDLMQQTRGLLCDTAGSSMVMSALTLTASDPEGEPEREPEVGCDDSRSTSSFKLTSLQDQADGALLSGGFKFRKTNHARDQDKGLGVGRADSVMEADQAQDRDARPAPPAGGEEHAALPLPPGKAPKIRPAKKVTTPVAMTPVAASREPAPYRPPTPEVLESKFKVGDFVEYWSYMRFKWIRATVRTVNEDGTYNLNRMPKVPEQLLREAPGAWLPAKVAAVNTDDTLDVELLPRPSGTPSGKPSRADVGIDWAQNAEKVRLDSPWKLAAPLGPVGKSRASPLVPIAFLESKSPRLKGAKSPRSIGRMVANKVETNDQKGPLDVYLKGRASPRLPQLSPGNSANRTRAQSGGARSPLQSRGTSALAEDLLGGPMRQDKPMATGSTLQVPSAWSGTPGLPAFQYPAVDSCGGHGYLDKAGFQGSPIPDYHAAVPLARVRGGNDGLAYCVGDFVHFFLPIEDEQPQAALPQRTARPKKLSRAQTHSNVSGEKQKKAALSKLRKSKTAPKLEHVDMPAQASPAKRNPGVSMMGSDPKLLKRNDPGVQSLPSIGAGKLQLCQPLGMYSNCPLCGMPSSGKIQHSRDCAFRVEPWGALC